MTVSSYKCLIVTLLIWRVVLLHCRLSRHEGTEHNEPFLSRYCLVLPWAFHRRSHPSKGNQIRLSITAGSGSESCVLFSIVPQKQKRLMRDLRVSGGLIISLRTESSDTSYNTTLGRFLSISRVMCEDGENLPCFKLLSAGKRQKWPLRLLNVWHQDSSAFKNQSQV